MSEGPKPTAIRLKKVCFPRSSLIRRRSHTLCDTDPHLNATFHPLSGVTHAPQKERRLEVDWADGRRSCLSAEFLRIHSPSIEGLEQDGTRRLISGRKGIGTQPQTWSILVATSAARPLVLTLASP